MEQGSSRGSKLWRLGAVDAVRGDGTYNIRYDNGEVGAPTICFWVRAFQNADLSSPRIGGDSLALAPVEHIIPSTVRNLGPVHIVLTCESCLRQLLLLRWVK